MKKNCIKMPKINFNCISSCCKSETTYTPSEEKDPPITLMCCVKVWTDERIDMQRIGETDQK